MIRLSAYSVKTNIARWRDRTARGLALLSLLAIGCARLPVPVEVIYEDHGLLVRVDRIGSRPEYTHPITLDAQDLAAVLKGFSARERPATGVLRWFGKPGAPDRVFSEDAVPMLALYLAEGLRAAKPNERVAFALYGEGNNPQVERVVTSGWIAVREPYLHLGIDALRNLQPRPADGHGHYAARSYYPFYPELPRATPEYAVHFEPEAYWRKDPADGTPAVHLRDYLHAVKKSGGH